MADENSIFPFSTSFDGFVQSSREKEKSELSPTSYSIKQQDPEMLWQLESPEDLKFEADLKFVRAQYKDALRLYEQTISGLKNSSGDDVTSSSSLSAEDKWNCALARESVESCIIVCLKVGEVEKASQYSDLLMKLSYPNNGDHMLLCHRIRAEICKIQRKSITINSESYCNELVGVKEEAKNWMKCIEILPNNFLFWHELYLCYKLLQVPLKSLCCLVRCRTLFHEQIKHVQYNNDNNLYRSIYDKLNVDDTIIQDMRNNELIGDSSKLEKMLDTMRNISSGMVVNCNGCKISTEESNLEVCDVLDKSYLCDFEYKWFSFMS